MFYLNRINLFLSVLCATLNCIATIREYQPHDLPAVCKIMKSHWNKLTTLPTYNQTMMDGMFGHQIPFDPAHKDKKLHIIVYEIDGSVVGFATYYYADAATSHVELLAIDPSHQSQGLGKQMMEYIQEECTRHHAHHIQLYVYPSNPKAIEFYKRLGFAIKMRALQHLLLSKALTNNENRFFLTSI